MSAAQNTPGVGGPSHSGARATAKASLPTAVSMPGGVVRDTADGETPFTTAPAGQSGKAGNRAPFRPWDEATTAAVREWAAAGVSQREIGRRLGMAQFSVALRMTDAGIKTKVRKPRSGEMERAGAVLVEHFATHPDLKEVLRLYGRARGTDKVTMKGMRAHSRKLRLVRPGESMWEGAKRGAAKVQAIHAAAAVELAPVLQASLNVTFSVPVSAKALGISQKRARRLVRLQMVTVPPRPKVAKVPKPKPPPAPRKPNKLPATWVRDSPRAPKPRYESVEAFLAAGGRIQFCPAAAAAVTTATLDEGRDVIRRYHEAAGETGNWKDRAKKKIGRVHFGASA